MRAIRVAACAGLLGGCLIVRTEDEIVDDPCPQAAPELLADASGPLAVYDAVYFIGANGTLSSVPIGGGPVSELTTDHVRATAIVADATGVYWASDTAIVRKPFDAAPSIIADGYLDIAQLVVDDASVAWVSGSGLDRWTKLEQTVSHLDDASPVFGLGVSDGVYYYSVYGAGVIRRTPPTEDIAPARSPGPLVVDNRGVYFYDVEDPFAEYGGALRLVPRNGGTVITTAPDISLALDLTSDDENLFFPSVYADEYRIKQVSRYGGTVHTLACGRFEQQRIDVEIVGPYVYWSDSRGLFRVPAYGTGAL